jgi:hypothetical protein
MECNVEDFEVDKQCAVCKVLLPTVSDLLLFESVDLLDERDIVAEAAVAEKKSLDFC